MRRVLEFVKAHPARVYAVLAACAALLPAVVGGVSTVALLGIVAALLGVGEKVQRTEDSKTEDALFTPVPDVLGEDLTGD